MTPGAALIDARERLYIDMHPEIVAAMPQWADDILIDFTADIDERSVGVTYEWRNGHVTISLCAEHVDGQVKVYGDPVTTIETTELCGTETFRDVVDALWDAEAHLRRGERILRRPTALTSQLEEVDN